MGKKPSLKISSAFKMLLCFITFVSILYFILIEKDFMKALFLLNVIANYRIMLAFMTDWNEEIIFRENSLRYDTHGITSDRKTYEEETEEYCNNVSHFNTISDIDSKKYDYLNSVYEDKINYNYNTYDNNFAWWSDY